MPLKLSDFDYELPPDLIAQAPLPERSGSRLLAMEKGQIADRQFSDLPSLLRAGDLLVFNDTRVIHARLYGVKDSGGKLEVLIERLVGKHEALAQIRASHAPKPGSTLKLEGALEVEVLSREGEFFLLRFSDAENLVDLLERYGKLPLPPYIQRAAVDFDESRYQTVYAKESGSVAAPTAGLHFDEAILARLREQGVNLAWLTLHVGAGTFQPVRVEDLSQHQMHRESYTLPAATVAAIQETKARGGRVIAVGTTSMRTLEAAAKNGLFDSSLDSPLLTNNQGADLVGDTDIFILPGFRFQVVDALITNFHLPKSTLLMLVSAFAGSDNIRHAYQHAIAQGYRFFSYGDAQFLTRLNEI